MKYFHLILYLFKNNLINYLFKMKCIFCNSTNTTDLKVYIVRPVGLIKYKCNNCLKFFTSKTKEDINENMIYETNTNEIMRDIEIRTEEQVIQLNKNTNNNIQQNIDALTEIMRKGSEEFKTNVGRPMTYSEMRQMFG